MKSCVKKIIYLFFAAALIYGLGFYSGLVCRESDIQDYRIRLAEANQHYAEARAAQLEAIERVSRLEDELERVTERANGLQKRIDRIRNGTESITAGIERAEDSVGDCAELIGECLEILRTIQESGRITD